MEIPSIDAMREYFQGYINDKKISTEDTGLLSKHTTWFFTKLGKDLGYFVRAGNRVKDLTKDRKQYPNDGGLLEVDLVWLTDNPYHLQKDEMYDWYLKNKEKSEMALALEYEATDGILDENDYPIHQCDELWKLSFVMAKVKVLIYATSTDKIDKHIAAFRDAISNIGIQQQPKPEWRIFAINGEKVIGTKISPNCID